MGNRGFLLLILAVGILALASAGSASARLHQHTREVNVQVVASLDVQVAASSDDGTIHNYGQTPLDFLLTDPGISLAYHGDLGGGAARLLDIAIPQGATITSSYLTFRSAGTVPGTSITRIWAQDSDDTVTFTTRAELDARPMTGAYVDWTVPPWGPGYDKQSADISSAIQEVISRPDWSSGNSLVLVWLDQSHTRTVSGWAYDGSTTYAPKLHIEWTEPTSTPTPTATSTATPTVTPTVTPVPRWNPPQHTTWQWQLTTPLNLSVAAEMWDIDLFDNSASVVNTLHGQGRKVVCYMSAGSWEDWRPDADDFPESVLGNDLDGWPGERWLDIRQLDVLGPIMGARLDLCRDKGFDGVEFDNVDGYGNNTGFPLGYSDQIAYNTWLANAAHERGLSAGLKNDLEQVADLEPLFDFAIVEQCFQYDECSDVLPFIEACKAVFEVEYSGTTDSFCPEANAMGFMSMKKRLSLNAWRQPCW